MELNVILNLKIIYIKQSNRMHQKFSIPQTQKEERQTASYERKAREAIGVNIVLRQASFDCQKTRKKENLKHEIYTF